MSTFGQRQKIIITMRQPGGPAALSDAALGRRLAWTLVALTVVMVLFCGMFPFDFAFHPSTAIEEIHRRFDLTLNEIQTAGDSGENIIFFLPFGLALGTALRIRWKRLAKPAWLPNAIGIFCGILASAALSSIVELSQVWLISRDPSLSDIVNNTIGGTLGFVIALVARKQVLRLLAGVSGFFRPRLNFRSLSIAAAVWAFAVILAPVMERNAGEISDWQISDHLAFGNEMSGDRGWTGCVSGLWLADRSIDGLDFELLAAGKDPVPLLGASLVADYAPVGKAPYPDLTKNNGPLVWSGERAAQEDTTADLGPAGLMVTPDRWLRSTGALGPTLRRIRDAGAFTVICDCATADLAQSDRYPRIISISQDVNHCDLQLIQDFDKLVIRLQTPATGDGGTGPEFAVPDVFMDNNPNRVVLAYSDGLLRIGVQRSGERFDVRITPEASLIWHVYPRPGWRYRVDSPGHDVCATLYRVFAFFILGFLAGGAANFMRRRPWIFVSAIIVLTAAALELTLLAINRGGFRIVEPAVSIAVGLAAAYPHLRKSTPRPRTI